RHEVRVFEWSHGFGRHVRDLQDTPHLLAKATELADEVRQVKAQGRPVFLVGHSGGAGLVLAAAAQLPPATVERTILLAPAVSPTFDLSAALRATKGELVSYRSELDRLWLGLGTHEFGTVDRVYGSAAGLHGFREPDHLTDEGRLLYRRLVQIPWRPE